MFERIIEGPWLRGWSWVGGAMLGERGRGGTRVGVFLTLRMDRLQGERTH